MSGPMYLERIPELTVVGKVRARVEMRHGHYGSHSAAKCVSKQWRSLISSRRFAKEHLKKKSTSTDDSDFGHHHHLLLFCGDKDHHSIGSCSLRSVLHEPKSIGPCNLPSETNTTTETLSFFNLQSLASATNFYDGPIKILNSDIQIQGSCNGLVLVSFTWVFKLFIWNPATRQAKNILAPPFPDLRALSLPTWHHFMYGFAYDESTDDYKVVRTRAYSYPYETHVYSSTACSWKKLEISDKRYDRFNFGHGKFVNGRLQWTVKRTNTLLNKHGWDVVCFDLVEEKYETFTGPEYLPDNIVFQPDVKDLGGYLSLICTTGRLFDVHVWVMMKYGDPQSWTKIWKFSDFYDHGGRVPRVMLLWLSKNGDMAVALGSDVVVLNGREKLRKSRVHIFDPRVNMIDSRIDSILYFEHLVSPFGDEENLR